MTRYLVEVVNTPGLILKNADLVSGELQDAHEARKRGIRELADLLLEGRNVRVVETDRRDIRLRHKPIVTGIFFAAKGKGFAGRGIKATRFAHASASRRMERRLALHLKVYELAT